MLHEYVQLRIAHANAVLLNVAKQAAEIAARLDAMLAEKPDLDDEFHEWYKQCASQTSVETAQDDMAKLIRKHFSGKRVDN